MAKEAQTGSHSDGVGSLDFLGWAYTPFRPLNAIGIYNLVSTQAFTEEGLYLNLGYWKNAQTIDQACEAMVSLVAETAAMGPSDDVVDVGFGFAQQDILWVERFAPRHITGLNLTPSQVRIARRRVDRRGMNDRIKLLEGSATDMRLSASSCDVVTAVESAFHFATRERFFGRGLPRTSAWRTCRVGRSDPQRSSSAPVSPRNAGLHLVRICSNICCSPGKRRSEGQLRREAARFRVRRGARYLHQRARIFRLASRVTRRSGADAKTATCRSASICDSTRSRGTHHLRRLRLRTCRGSKTTLMSLCQAVTRFDRVPGRTGRRIQRN